MVFGDYRDLFVVIATSAATLIGLLFVAISVSKSRSQAGSGDIRGRLPIRSRPPAHLQVGPSAGVAHAACLVEKVQVCTAARPEDES